MAPRESRVTTGVPALDDALGGGIPQGTIVLAEGAPGAGATEFALALAAATASRRPEGARFLTGCRATARAEREMRALLDDDDVADAILVRDPPPHALAEACRAALKEMTAGDVLVVEDASTLVASAPRAQVPATVRDLGDVAATRGVTLVLLATPETLAPDVRALVRDAADLVFSFQWQDGGSARHRLLFVPKVRGLAPALSGGRVPVFEIALVTRVGVTVSRVKNVV